MRIKPARGRANDPRGRPNRRLVGVDSSIAAPRPPKPPRPVAERVLAFVDRRLATAAPREPPSSRSSVKLVAPPRPADLKR